MHINDQCPYVLHYVCCNALQPAFSTRQRCLCTQPAQAEPRSTQPLREQPFSSPDHLRMRTISVGKNLYSSCEMDELMKTLERREEDNKADEVPADVVKLMMHKFIC